MGAIIVTGIPGVGKTTVMDAAAKSKGLKVVVFGSIMFEEASASSPNLVKSRDDMRRLPAALQQRYQREAAMRIHSMGDVIVDTHCSVKTGTGYLPGLPAWVLEELKPATIVLVEADPKEIQGRRQKDATRNRDVDNVEAIAEHQEYNRRFAAAYATLTGATVHTVVNRDGSGGLEAAIKQILPVVGVR